MKRSLTRSPGLNSAVQLSRGPFPLTRNVGKIGRVHPHFAPFEAVLERGAEAVAVRVAEKVDQRPLAPVVIPGVGLELGHHPHRVFLGMVGKRHHIVAVGADGIAAPGLDHDSPVHAGLLLQAGMAVVPIGAALAELEAVGEGLARRDRSKSVESRRAVHVAVEQQPVPVDRGRFLETVGGLDGHFFAFAPAQRRRRNRTAHHDSVALDSVDDDPARLDGNRVFFRRRGEADPAGIDGDEAGRAGELERVPPGKAVKIGGHGAIPPHHPPLKSSLPTMPAS